MKAFRIRDRSGLTLVELIVAFAILMVLSSMAMPLARVKVQREKERLLRERLSDMRKAIDRFKDAADAGILGGELDPDSHGYPESLELMVEGVSAEGGMGMGMGGMGMGMGQQGGMGGRSGMGNRSGGAFGGQSAGGFGGQQRGGRQGGGAFGGQQRGGAFGGQQGRSGMGGSSSGFGNSRGGMGSRSGGGMGGMDGDDEEQTIRFLRKIPVDPMTGQADWGMRSMNDDPQSFSWGGDHVFDVFSKSMDQSLDGTYYRDW